MNTIITFNNQNIRNKHIMYLIKLFKIINDFMQEINPKHCDRYLSIIMVRSINFEKINYRGICEDKSWHWWRKNCKEFFW